MEEKTTVITETAIERTDSEKFTSMVMREFGTNGGMTELSNRQKDLVCNYFVKIDRAIKMYEENRLKANEKATAAKYKNELKASWNNVNLTNLSLDCVHYAKVGLDMMTENHLVPILYKDNKNNKYNIVLMEGYNGKRYIAETLAMDKPSNVVIEVVYSNDTFNIFKKDANNPYEHYTFVAGNPFDRGEIVGGFWFTEYENPAKNKVRVMTMADIKKRKPEKASANFWGGTSTQWDYDAKKNVSIEVEGWMDEMVYKTLVRDCFNARNIPRDPRKAEEFTRYEITKEMREAQDMAAIEMEAQQSIVIDSNGGIVDDNNTDKVIDTVESPTVVVGEQIKMDLDPGF